MTLPLILAAWLALRLPEACEADSPLDALTTHAAAVVAATPRRSTP